MVSKIPIFFNFFVFFIIFFAINNPCQIIAKEKYSVVIIQSQDIAAYNDAINGFKKGCKRKGILIKEVFNLKGFSEEGVKVIKNIKRDKEKPDLIFAVGILAASLVKEQFHDIPVIFCMVINYRRFNLQGDNLTGISSEASIEDQFSILKKLITDLDKVGVLYDPKKTGKIITEGKQTVQRLGIELFPMKVSSSQEVASALTSLKNKIGALWILPDSTVINKESLKAILRITEEAALPAFCTSNKIAMSGALISISPDYTSTGIQAAQIAQKLLINHGNSSLGVYQPMKLVITVNTKVAKRLGVDIAPLKSYQNVILYP